MTAVALLNRHGLAAAEVRKVSLVHAEAFHVLTASLGRIGEICEALFDDQGKVEERRSAPRYSRDFRRLKESC